MPNITLSIPDNLRRKMKRHPEVNWSEVVRRLIAERLRDMEAMDKITAKSGLAPADVGDVDHTLKAALLRRYRKSEASEKTVEENHVKVDDLALRPEFVAGVQRIRKGRFRMVKSLSTRNRPW
jgi:hypothetical protein